MLSDKITLGLRPNRSLGSTSLGRENMSRHISGRKIALVAAVSASMVLSVGLTSASNAAAKKVTVSLITKDSTNPFFVAMQAGAKKNAKALGVNIVIGSGAKEGDVAGQVRLIENAIANKEQGILITPTAEGVNAAILKARKAGLFVIALDTPPVAKNIVDITYATDNFLAGVNIGKWTAAKLGGKKAVIAMLDIYTDQIASVDLGRDQGFLKGMGIAGADPAVNGKEPATGKYTGGKGGDYQICGHVASHGNSQDGQTGMEQLLAKCPDINVVYSINEPSGLGAYAALTAAGKSAIISSVDGGSAGIKAVAAGKIGATSQQYPLQMAVKGMQAIKDLITKGIKPKVTPGLSFFNTGTTLITDDPQAGVPSKDTKYGLANAWG